MRRQWSHTIIQPDQDSDRFATALGLLCDEPYARTMIAVVEAVYDGHGVRLTAKREKFDPASGDQLDDQREPGDYETVGYSVEVGDGEEILDREAYEGTPPALGFARALGTIADPRTIERLVQIKCLLDCIGGQAFIRPYVRDGQVLGVLCHFEHLSKDEPDASIYDPIPLNGASPGLHAEGDSPPASSPAVEQGQEDADEPALEPEEAEPVPAEV